MTDQQRQDLQKEVDLQKIANEKRQMMNDRIVKKMDTVFFPNDQLSVNWRAITKRALMNTIPVVNKTSLYDFVAALKAVSDPGGNITMTQFQILANSLDTASPASMGYSVDEYLEAVDIVTSTVEIWKKLLEQLNDETTIEVEKEISKKFNGKGAIMSPVKGEA